MKEVLDKTFAPIILAALVASFMVVTENVYLAIIEFRNDRFDYTRLFYVVMYSIPTWNVVSSCTTVTMEVSTSDNGYSLCIPIAVYVYSYVYIGKLGNRRGPYGTSDLLSR